MTDSPLTHAYAPRLRVGRTRAWPWRTLAAVALVGVAGVGIWRGELLRGWGAGSLRNAEFQRVEPVDLAITLTESGELKPVEALEIKSEVEGQATILKLVSESTRVKAGDVLVELASDEIVERVEQEEIELRKLTTQLEAAGQDLSIQRNQNTSDIRKAEIDLMLAVRELDKYKEGDFIKAQKSIEIRSTETQLKRTQKQQDLEKNQNLMERGFVTKATIDELELELKTLNLELEQSELEARILLEYEQPMQIKQKESDIEQARQALERVKAAAASKEAQAVAAVSQFESLVDVRKKRLERQRQQLEHCRIVAPRDGVVQYASQEGGFRFSEPLKVGSKVTEGQTLVVLPDTSRMVVSIRIHESDRHRIELGLPCDVKVPAVPERVFPGKITKIAKFADSANSWLNPELKEHATEVLLDTTDAPLSPGDSAEVKIHVDYRDNVLAVPVQAVHTRGAQAFVLARRGAGVEPVKVKLGPSNVSQVEITEGLVAGDQVLLNADERSLALLPNPRAAQETGNQGAARHKRRGGPDDSKVADADAEKSTDEEAKPAETPEPAVQAGKK